MHIKTDCYDTLSPQSQSLITGKKEGKNPQVLEMVQRSSSCCKSWRHQGRVQMVTAHGWRAQQGHARVQGNGAEGSAWRPGSQPGSCGQTDRQNVHAPSSSHRKKMKLSFAALQTEVEVTVSSMEIQVTKDKFHMW